MQTQTTKVLAVAVTILGILGLVVTGRFLGLINMDPALDVARLILAAILIYAGFISRTELALRTSLLITGSLYVGLAILGLRNTTIGGLLPTGLSQADILLHAAGGIYALWAGIRNTGRLLSRSSRVSD